MFFLQAKVADDERFLNQVKTHALRRRRVASDRERRAMDFAFSSKNEELWAIGDNLVDAIDGGQRRYKRVVLCQQIENVMERCSELI